MVNILIVVFVIFIYLILILVYWVLDGMLGLLVVYVGSNGNFVILFFIFVLFVFDVWVYIFFVWFFLVVEGWICEIDVKEDYKDV